MAQAMTKAQLEQLRDSLDMLMDDYANWIDAIEYDHIVDARGTVVVLIENGMVSE